MPQFLSSLIRIALCLLVMGGWYFGVWLLAIPLTLWYVFTYPAYELILIGLLIDIQFYTGDFVPYYFVAALLLVVGFRIASPLIRSRSMV